MFRPSHIIVAAVTLASALTGASSGRAFADGERAATPDVGVIECGAPAEADKATLEARAGEHFARGNDLYLEGQYEQAIAEFQAVYCLVPVPEAAFNLAQSYLGLVDYERAISWLDIYAHLLPAGAADKRRLAENRIDRLRKLPARVRVSSDPSGAKVTLSGPSGSVEGHAGDADPLRINSGSYTLEVTLPGYVPVHEQIELRIGQPYTFSYRLALETGPVRITTEPFSARIFVDDKLVGVGTYVTDLPVGAHQLTVEATGRPSRTESIDVTTGKPVQVHVRLPPQRSSGRWELVSGAAVFGGVAGYNIANSLVKESTSRVFLGFGAAGVAIAGAYLGIPEDIPVGWSSFILGGATWATIQSLAASYLLSVDDPTQYAILTSGIAVTVIGTSLAASHLDLSEGDAAIINSGVLWGTGTGLILWGVFDRAKNLSGVYMIAGSNLGLLAGIGLASKYEFSRGHIALIDLAGITGMFLGLVLAEPIVDHIDSLTVGDDTRLHFALGGTLLGLTIGALLTRNLDEPKIPRALRTGTATPTIGTVRAASGENIPILGFAGRF